MVYNLDYKTYPYIESNKYKVKDPGLVRRRMKKSKQQKSKMKQKI